jgi:hypothetical protein
MVRSAFFTRSGFHPRIKSEGKLRSKTLDEAQVRSAANPDAAEPPDIAVPKTLPLPEAARATGGGIGWSVVVARGISIGIRGGSCNRAADDGAADDPAGNSRANAALGMGWRRHGRYGQGYGSGKGHQTFPHGITFLIEEDRE